MCSTPEEQHHECDHCRSARESLLRIIEHLRCENSDQGNEILNLVSSIDTLEKKLKKQEEHIRKTDELLTAYNFPRATHTTA